MNLSHVSNDLRPLVEEVTSRFKGRIGFLYAPHLNEIYLQGGMDLVSAFCAQLSRNWKARLVTVFTDDARAGEGVFHLCYVLALDAAHGFLILRWCLHN
jgi:hypothetical protein